MRSLSASAPAAPAGVPTGHPALDACLPGGGWPRRALTELLSSSLPAGVGELRLLAPVLAAAVQAGRPVMLFDPPPRLSAWALAQVGLDAAQLLVIDGRSPVLPDASSLWAIEQALKSGQVGAMVAWLPPRLCAERLRRLHLAARQHDGAAFVVRERAACTRPTSAPLRLALQADGADRLALRLLARRSPAPDDALRLALPPLLRPAEALAAVPRVASSKVSGVLGAASRGATDGGCAGAVAGACAADADTSSRARASADGRAAVSGDARHGAAAATLASVGSPGFEMGHGCDAAAAAFGGAARGGGAAVLAARRAALHAPLRSAVFVDLGG